MEIVPAILEENKEAFEGKLSKLASFATRIQVDFNDGSFAGFHSLKPGDLADLLRIYADKIAFEAHLMVQRPRGDKWIERLRDLGFKKIIIQYEIEDDIRAVLEEVKRLGMKAGLAIGPVTSAFEIEPFADLLDTITVMDVEPGKQGQKFLPAELEKIRELKDGNFDGEVQADGAITDETIAEVVSARPDTLVVGSYIVGGDDSGERYSELVSLLAGE